MSTTFSNHRTRTAMLSCAQFSLRLIASVCCCTWAALLSAQSTDVAEQVCKLLDTDWQKPSFKAFTAAQQLYPSLKQSAAADARVPHAMALIATKNYRLTEAIKYLDEALARGKPLLPIWQMKVVIAVQHKDKTSTKAAISGFVKVLGADETFADRADYQDSAGFLGRVMGYFATSGKNALKAEDLATVEAEMIGKLKGPLATALAEGKASAEKQYGELHEEWRTKFEEANTRNRAKFATELEKIIEAIKRATESRKKSEEEYTQFVADHREAYNALAREQCSLIQKKIRLGRGRLIEKNKETGKETYENDDELTWLSSKQSDIRKKLNVYRDECNSRLKIIKRKVLEEPKLQRIADGLIKRSNSGDSVSTSLEKKLKSIATYADFDLDREKQRIIDSYRQQK